MFALTIVCAVSSSIALEEEKRREIETDNNNTLMIETTSVYWWLYLCRHPLMSNVQQGMEIVPQLIDEFVDPSEQHFSRMQKNRS
jgi:hypothetical protein